MGIIIIILVCTVLLTVDHEVPVTPTAATNLVEDNPRTVSSVSVTVLVGTVMGLVTVFAAILIVVIVIGSIVMMKKRSSNHDYDYVTERALNGTTRTPPNTSSMEMKVNEAYGHIVLGGARQTFNNMATQEHCQGSDSELYEELN